MVDFYVRVVRESKWFSGKKEACSGDTGGDLDWAM